MGIVEDDGSRKLNPVEEKHAAVELEALAVIFTTTKAEKSNFGEDNLFPKAIISLCE